jgi:hypothetical protein
VKKMAIKKENAPLLSVGATAESVKALHMAIESILNAPHADEATKRCALSTLANGVRVDGTSIMNCTFQG